MSSVAVLLRPSSAKKREKREREPERRDMLQHSMAGFMLLISTPSPAGEPEAIPTVRIRENGPAVTLAQARTMKPAVLGDLLLAPGHLPVTEAAIGPAINGPPPPPGMPVATPVRLYLRPIQSKQPGFCERTIATVFLKPVYPLEGARLPASGPDKVTTQTAYQWIGSGRNASPCKPSRYNFFSPRFNEEQQALAAVRLLASASQKAKRGSRLSFPVSVEDKFGPKILALEREYPYPPSRYKTEVFTDAKKALASLPVDAVQFAGPAATAYPKVLSASDLHNVQGRRLHAITIFLGGVWTAGLVIDDDRIIRMRLLREIPAPF